MSEQQPRSIDGMSQESYMAHQCLIFKNYLERTTSNSGDKTKFKPGLKPSEIVTFLSLFENKYPKLAQNFNFTVFMTQQDEIVAVRKT